MKNILIVDDDKFICSMIERGLKIHAKGFNVLRAENGKQAMEILRLLQVDILLTDLHMPEIDGYDLLAYATKEMPSIEAFAMTGDYNQNVRNRLSLLGVHQCFEKPLDLKEVASTITSQPENIKT